MTARTIASGGELGCSRPSTDQPSGLRSRPQRSRQLANAEPLTRGLGPPDDQSIRMMHTGRCRFVLVLHKGPIDSPRGVCDS